MAILRLQHIGMAVTDLGESCAWFESTFGLKARDFRNDQGHGFQLDARIPLGNECWLHLVQNWNPESRVNQFLNSHGPGLEHIALQTDTIEADVQHLRDLGVPIYADKIFNAADGFEAFVYPDQTLCMTVELIQPHASSWTYPADAGPVSQQLEIQKMDHLGLAVVDVAECCERLHSLYGLDVSAPASNPRIPLPNDCWLALAEASNGAVEGFLSKYGPGLEHIAFETGDLEHDTRAIGTTAELDGSPDDHLGGRAGAGIGPNDAIGTRVELVQRKR